MYNLTKLKNYLPLFLIIIVFLMPIITAHVMFSNIDKLKLNTTQHGSLIIPPLELTDSFDIYDLDSKILKILELKSKWTLLFFEGKTCDIKCNNRKNLLNNLYSALHGNKELVNVVTSKEIEFAIDENDVNILPGSILLLDKNSKVMMRYQPNQNLSDVLKDIRKLLKYQHT